MIEIRNISKTYDKGSKALKDIDIRIQDGEFVFIMGRSGSGKSTLIRLLLKEAEPSSGRIIVNDMDLQKMPPLHTEIPPPSWRGVSGFPAFKRPDGI